MTVSKLRRAYHFFGLATLVLLVLSSTGRAAESLGQQHFCRYCQAKPDYGDPVMREGRKFAPDRKVDVLHMRLEVTPDFAGRSVSGNSTITFKPVAQPLETLLLHAFDLDVKEVTASLPIRGHRLTREGIEVTFQNPIPLGTKASVNVVYATQPKHGLIFRTPELGYPEGDAHVWTQGEPHLSRYWYPSVDYPNEHFTSEMICYVPQAMTALSNGRLVSETLDRNSGLKRVHWLQEKPHVNYLVALVAGYLKKIEDKHGNLSLGFYTPPSRIGYAANPFRDTRDMMGFFEKDLNTKFPWHRYDQVVVDDFIMGGMENTTLTILNRFVLFPEETENLRSGQTLIAHELAHQWFGDLVTCKDWSHLWLNEGFAVYYSYLYDEHKNGRDSMLASLYNDSNGLTSRTEKRPMVFRDYKSVWDQFDARAYSKGGWVVHMLRRQLGDELYQKSITEYLRRHAYQSVTSDDLRRVMEDVSGQSLDRFFDQWVYNAGIPRLAVSESWDAKLKLAKVSVTQTNSNEKAEVFELPLTIRFRTDKGTVDERVVITEKKQDFYVSLPAKPTVVRFDVHLDILAKVTFKKSKAMLYAQLEDTADVVGRLRAIEGLKKHEDAKTVEKLTQVLNNDPFHGVQTAAANALAGMKTKAAREALIASMDQKDARIRRQVISSISSYYEPEVKDLMVQVLDSEKNPDIVATAIRGLGRYPDADLGKRLVGYLWSQSFENTLATAATDTLRTWDDAAYIVPLQDALARRRADYPPRAFANNLNALAFLARQQEDRSVQREFFKRYLHDGSDFVRAGAIRALGTLRDPKAIPVVEAFVGEPGDRRVKKAADEAIAKLRDEKKIPVELGDLRGEVNRLKKDNAKIRQEFDDLKAAIEAFKSAQEQVATDPDPGAAPAKQGATPAK